MKLDCLLAVLVSSTLAAAPLAAQKPKVRDVRVAPKSYTMRLGQKKAFSVSFTDAKGQAVFPENVRWRSTNEAVVMVQWNDAAPNIATVTAVGLGSANVDAIGDGRAGSALVEVVEGGDAVGPAKPQATLGPATVMRLEPAALWLIPGEEAQLIAKFFQEDGSPARNEAVKWESLTPVANINDKGMVVALREGAGFVQATTTSGLRARIQVQVQQAKFRFRRTGVSLSPGSKDTLRVYIPSQNGRSFNPLLLQWLSSNVGVVRVSQNGVLTAVAPGSAEVKATLGFNDFKIPVKVHEPVEELRVIPEVGKTVLVPMGGSIRIAGRAMAANGEEIKEAILNWEVGDTTLISYDADAQRVSGKQLGKTTLKVRGPGPGLEAQWNIEVIAGGLLLSVNRAGLGVGEQKSVSASFTDSTGTPISPASDLVWTSSDDAVATVDQGGSITATGIGHALIIASTPWKSADTADIYVQGELLFTSSRGGSWDIYAVDRSSLEAPVQITNAPGDQMSAVYSPDGSRIAYVSTQDGNPEIYVANADGSDPVRLTDTPSLENMPSWTGDGEQIVYQSNATGKTQIWIMKRDGSNAHALTEGDATNFQPAVSPNGRQIAFTSTRDGSYDIFLMGIDGSNQRNITKTARKQTRPVWFPDNKLGFLIEERSGSDIKAFVMRADLGTGEIKPVSPKDHSVTDYAVSGDGELLAVVITRLTNNGGITRKIAILQIKSGLSGQAEIPQAIAGEQILDPAFRW